MVGQTISRYRVLGELGAGATGVVYLAEDPRLHREVALKLLKPHVLGDAEALERFRREARVTSALNHPHICIVHDIGESEGAQFIVMERLEGESLDQVIARGRLPIPRVVQLAIDVCEALGATHALGIVHRDVKPRNIFVTSRGDAKVVDFGLAKVRVATAPDDPTRRMLDLTEADLTRPGSTLGTIAYMAPEQARGQVVDARADLFSLGAVVYEMATGRRPFQGDTAALVFDAILNRTPAPAESANRAVTPALQAVLDRALEKDRSRRYQTAAEMLADLRALQPGAPAPQIRRLWSRPTPAPRPARRVAVVSGAFAALLAVVAAVWFVTSRGRATMLSERDPVVLGAFHNTTGEPVFDDTLRHALAVHLGQSTYLDIVGDERVAETLRLMGRPPDSPLTADLAREVCARQEAKAVIDGAISRTGPGYAIAVEARGCQDGRTLAIERGEVARKEDVLTGLARIAAALRAALGESLNRVGGLDAPAEQATTASLEALEAYTRGIAERAKGREIEAIPLFERAIHLDPHFASAYNALSTIYGSAGDAVKGAEYGRRAYAEREYVSERERLSITFQYHDRVTGDLEKAISALTIWERSFLRDYSPSNSLALIYGRIGQFDRAVSHGQEALRRNPNHPFPYSNLAYAYRGLNRWEDAKDVAQQAAARGFETVPTRRLLYQIAELERNTSAASEHLSAVRGHPREFDLIGARAQVAAFEGRRREARELYAKTEVMARQGRLAEIADGYAIQASWMELLLGDREAAIERARPVLASRDPNVRLGAAAVLALAGAHAGLEHVIADVAGAHRSNTLTTAVSISAARGASLMAQGRPAAAVEALAPASPYELGRMAALVPTWLRGQALLAAGRPAAAAEEFRRVLAHRGTEPFSMHFATAPLGLARSLAQLGDTLGARRAYEALIAQWDRADFDLPAVEEARREFARFQAKQTTP